jgi:hypothetical protein
VTAGASAWREEHWTLAFAMPDGDVAGVVRFGLWPTTLWCWIHIVTADGLVVVRDHELPRPAPGRLLARGEGIWCELIPEVPDEHWAANAEAFGVRLDSPLDALHGEIGHRIPVGFELDWEVGAARQAVAGGSAHAGTVRGEVLLGAEVLDVDGAGPFVHRVREHEWNATPESEVLLCDAASATPLLGSDSVTVAVDGPDVVGVDGAVRADPIAQAPVPLDHPSGATGVLARALCRTAGGDAAATWLWADRVVRSAG